MLNSTVIFELSHLNLTLNCVPIEVQNEYTNSKATPNIPPQTTSQIGTSRTTQITKPRITNYSLLRNVSPQCSFCGEHMENLNLLVWSCNVVQEFWKMIKNCISNFYPEFILQRKEAIFGHVGSSNLIHKSQILYRSVINTILALARYFIYKQKFTSKELDEIKFLNYMRDHLEIIYQTKVNKNHERNFLE